MNWMFQDFLESAEAYHAAQSYWEELFLKSLSHRSDMEIVSHYINNGDNDGNPIFTAVSLTFRLAVRIIQQPIGEPGDLDLDYWIHSTNLDSGVAVQELVISCCPSKENKPRVERLLRDWFSKGEIVAFQPHIAQP